MSVEEARLRAEYDEFRALKRLNDGPEDLPVINPKIIDDFEPDEFNGKIRFKAKSEDAPDTRSAVPSPDVDAGFAEPGLLSPPVSGFASPLPAGASHTVSISFGGGDRSGGGPIDVVFKIPAPSSVAVVIHQSNVLHDSDQWNTDAFQGPIVSKEVLEAALEKLVDAGKALQIFSPAVLPDGEVSYSDMAHSLVKFIEEVEVPEVEGAQITLLKGDDAYGLHVNGEEVTELPSWQDHIPAYLAPPPAEGAGEGADANADESLDENLAASAEGTTPVTGPAEDEGPAHQAVHGGNLLVNEVVLSASWLYAPVMLVGGDSVSLHMISQINVWNDDHVSFSADADEAGDSALTTAWNVASLIRESAPAEQDKDPVDAKFPEHWAITRIEGDVINVSWIKQFNFVVDNDVTAMTFSGSESNFVFGGNEITNSVSLYELGFQYDLIVVGGHLINLAMINQMNVLLDTDAVTLDNHGGVVGSGGNLLWNEAAIYELGSDTIMPLDAMQKQFITMLGEGANGVPGWLLKNEAFSGDTMLSVLYIDGNLINSQSVEQTNVLGDADQVELLAGELLASAGDDGVTVTTGSNALLNLASIEEYGTDSTVHVGGEHYSDALLYQAELISLEDPMSGESDLASEAVAFLAEGMIEDQYGNDDGHPSNGHGNGHGNDAGSADVMQTMLA
ncbi:hypothetical protein [Defluviimonas salinarum]|uniref:Type I secretion protein n=1 Tax=Defluviimonas salinarum TaxID=2992147 RepID=A0ABT3IYD4_9RHOB|nr:hypothetical protein [Defluviimonas salinarum]MCW3780205.1 hypothetical protein [Defluviimonas salinarum]